MATKHFLSIPPGADLTDPTRASKPAVETYKAPKLDRGSVVIERLDPAGNPMPRSRYGQNGGDTPSSVGVTQAAGSDGTGLSDYDIAPGGGDPVLKKLALEGFGDRSGEDNAVADLQRKVSTDQYPTTYGQRNRSGEGAKVPSSTGSAANAAPPIRQPGK
jgi:hypothetical protein